MVLHLSSSSNPVLDHQGTNTGLRCLHRVVSGGQYEETQETRYSCDLVEGQSKDDTTRLYGDAQHHRRHLPRITRYSNSTLYRAVPLTTTPQYRAVAPDRQRISTSIAHSIIDHHIQLHSHSSLVYIPLLRVSARGIHSGPLLQAPHTP